MGMNVGGDRSGPKCEINITPFVDVVLVLLIIFMVLTPLVLKEISLSIPRRADEEVTADIAAQQMLLTIDAAGKLRLLDRKVELGSLRAEVRRLFAGRDRKVLFVDIDDRANYGLAVTAMDLCRGAGVSTLGMVTRSEATELK
jgi:biopolymer transport protein ExbD